MDEPCACTFVRQNSMVMSRMRTKISVSGLVVSALIFMNLVILNAAYTRSGGYYWTLLLSIPLLFIAIWLYWGKDDLDSTN